MQKPNNWSICTLSLEYQCFDFPDSKMSLALTMNCECATFTISRWWFNHKKNRSWKLQWRNCFQRLSRKTNQSHHSAHAIQNILNSWITQSILSYSYARSSYSCSTSISITSGTFCRTQRTRFGKFGKNAEFWLTKTFKKFHGKTIFLFIIYFPGNCVDPL